MVKTIIDENAYSSPLGKISGHQRSIGIFLFEILVDNTRLVNHGLPVEDDRHLSIRIQPKKIRFLLFACFEIDRN
jgi:hypothetical protein